MRYSVRGNIQSSSCAPLIVLEINKYQLWRFVTQDTVGDDGLALFTFEAWVNSKGDKTSLFNDLKPFADQYGGWIDWHECSHDEAISKPCVIVETYMGG